MAQNVRRLTSQGVSLFRSYLADLKKDGSLPVPTNLLNDSVCSEAIPHAPTIERPAFSAKRDIAEYLATIMESVEKLDIMKDCGLWSWLSLYYFDEVCPMDSDGKRTPLADPHYILDTDYKRRYRHLLATAYQIIRAIPQYNRVWLNRPISTHGDLLEQTMGRLYLLRMPAVCQVVDRLYYDAKKGVAKPGIVPHRDKEKPGDLRNRLPIRVRQLQKTYDVAAMTGDHLLALLGKEFAGWLTK